MAKRKQMNSKELIDHIMFLASANRLSTKARFTQSEKSYTYDQLRHSGAGYYLLLALSRSMNKEKNYEVIVTMLRSKSKFNTKDQKLILEMAEAFIRDVGEN